LYPTGVINEYQIDRAIQPIIRYYMPYHILLEVLDPF
jgi:hypothetical protein